MKTARYITATASLLLAGAAQAMTSGSAPIGTQRQPQAPQQITAPAQTQARLQTFAINVGGVAIAIPLTRGLCALDTRQAFDKGLLDGFRNGAGSALVLYGATADCNQLALARQGQGEALTSVHFYAAPSASVEVVSQQSAQDFALDVCRRELQRLNQQAAPNANPEQAADQLMQAAESSAERQTSVLFTGQRSCYVGTSERASNGAGLVNTIAATTLVRGKTVLLLAASFGPNGVPVRQLLAEARTVTPALLQANGGT